MVGCFFHDGVAISPDEDIISNGFSTVHSSHSKLSSILLWNSSGATLMPKGILFHFILPTGVLKVVRRELGSSSGTCQKADLM